MPRYDDHYYSPTRWTNAKLMREAKRLGGKGPEISFESPFAPKSTADYKTRYAGWNESWLRPILDEIEKRFLKTRNAQ
jgi:hypothetical protein